MAPNTLFIASALLAVGISAQSCPYIPYTNITNYPSYNSSCANDDWDYELALGKTSIKEATIKCQQACNAIGDDCNSVVVQLYEEKLSKNVFTGNCFFYQPGNDAALMHEKCDKPACVLEGFAKKEEKKKEDSVLACYTSSAVAATTYCQSVLGATVTATVTTTPPVSTFISNSTITGFQNATTILTNTYNSTITVTGTTTIYTSPTVATLTTTFTASVTAFTTSTTTLTTTLTSTVTTQAPIAKAKRTDDASETSPVPQCIASDIPQSRLFSACSVFHPEPTTITTTVAAAVPITTQVANISITLTKPVTNYVSVTVVASTDSETVSTTIESDQTATTSTTITTTTTSTIAATLTLSTTVTVTKTIAPSVYCGLPDGYSITATATGVVSCTAGSVASPSSNALLRIEGATGAVFEGCVVSGPRNVTTPSGGTHLCDATNNNANPHAYANGIAIFDSAAKKTPFTYDGTYSSQFQDFFITRIGTSDSNTTPNQYWGILLNGAFTPAGGCQTQVNTNDKLLWAFNAFNVNFFLNVSPGWATAQAGQGSVTVTVTGSDGNSNNNNPISSASIAGQTTNGNGQAVIPVPSVPGCYAYKATRADSIRSNTFYLNVVSSF